MEARDRAWALAEDEVGEGPETLRADALNDVTRAIVDQIEGTHALTLDGLQVKLRAIMWCRSSEPITAAAVANPPVVCFPPMPPKTEEEQAVSREEVKRPGNDPNQL